MGTGANKLPTNTDRVIASESYIAAAVAISSNTLSDKKRSLRLEGKPRLPLSWK